MAPVCRYWQRGDCRNGANCKFDHPRDLPRNDNRFAGFQSNDNGPRNSSGRLAGDGRSSPQNLPFSINKDQIIADLSTERPQWILSAYGPGVRAPAQLFGGPAREQSFEEMRLHHYQGVASGSEVLAKQQANSLVQEAESQMRNTLSDIDGAIEFIRSAQNQHPNRIDICRTSTENRASTSSISDIPLDMKSVIPIQPASAFGQPSVFGQPSSFGQPSAFGVKPDPFGGPPRGPTLGLGQNQNSGFSNFAGATNPFAATSQLHLGQPLSQPWSNPISMAATSDIFASSPIQQNPFNAASQVKPGVETTVTGPSNLFSQATSISSANPFSQQSTIANGIQGNPFARPSQEGNPESNGMAGVGPYVANASLEHPPLESYASRDADNRLRIFKGNQVVYKYDEAGLRGRDGTWQKIWFPGGAPAFYGATEMDESAYTADIQASYLHLRETGSYKDGVMPFIPPKRAWCRWDF